MPAILIVATGTANLASIAVAVRRCGNEPTISSDSAAIEQADLLILPGVGSFNAGMNCLNEQKLADPLRQRITDNRPTLAICLGMQLLCKASEESPDTPGLSVVDATAARFCQTTRSPQMGWNRIKPDPDCTLLQPGFAYFANSYRLAKCPPTFAAATADHAGSFIAAIERGPILACQFHPELSGQWGMDLIDCWIKLSTNALQGAGAC